MNRITAVIIALIAIAVGAYLFLSSGGDGTGPEPAVQAPDTQAPDAQAPAADAPVPAPQE